MVRIPREQVRFETVNVGPNGSWLHAGRPFTGIAYTLGPNGEVDCEQAFRDGLRWGLCWERYRSGQMYAESTFCRDLLHGRAREWHENGQLAEEGEYEYGIALRERKWDVAGALVEEYTLAEADGNYSLLQSFRNIYGDVTDAEPNVAGDRGPQPL